MIKYTVPNLAQPPVRGLRSASLPIAPGDGAAGVQRITFTDDYLFNYYVSPDAGSPGQFHSLIHGSVASRGVSQQPAGKYGPAGAAAYYNADATTMDSPSDETFQTVFSPPDIAGQPIQNPLWGCNKLSCALAVMDTVDGAGSSFTLGLYRAINPEDNALYFGNQADASILVKDWTFASLAVGTAAMNLVIQSYVLPVGSSFYLRLKNTTSATNLNVIAGDIFFHS